MAGECDAACIKIIIDTGMGAAAATLYRNVMNDIPLQVAAAEFYAEVAETVTLPAARALNLLHLSADQQERLDAQINLQCYPRADYLLKWAKMSDEERAEKAARWTDTLFEWVADDQKFLIDLAAELKHDDAKE